MILKLIFMNNNYQMYPVLWTWVTQTVLQGFLPQITLIFAAVHSCSFSKSSLHPQHHQRLGWTSTWMGDFYFIFKFGFGKFWNDKWPFSSPGIHPMTPNCPIGWKMLGTSIKKSWCLWTLAAIFFYFVCNSNTIFSSSWCKIMGAEIINVICPRFQ